MIIVRMHDQVLMAFYPKKSLNLFCCCDFGNFGASSRSLPKTVANPYLPGAERKTNKGCIITSLQLFQLFNLLYKLVYPTLLILSFH